MSEDRKLTEGEYRVGVTFNPSQLQPVADVKAKIAELIDYSLGLTADRNAPGAREAAIAATHLEDAAMWLVKAITKPPR